MIRFAGVSKAFGEVEVLEDIDLTINEGEFVSLIGPSGCGKTTLLRMVAGLEVPTAGSVLVNGELPKVACRRRQIGVAFQQPALLPHRTALANVHLTLEVAGLNDGLLTPDKLLEDFGLDGFKDHYPHQLSGGMRQRVDIACALVHNPSVLLMDEPFGALDEMTRERMGGWLSRVLKSPKTVLFVTHNIEEAVFLSDRVIILAPRPGRICYEVEVQLDRPRTKSLRTNDEFLRMVARAKSQLYEVAE